MHSFKPSTRLCDIIIADPLILTVANRFGIFPGVGGASLEEICRNKGIDLDFFLVILNTFAHADYSPSGRINPLLAARYLRKTDEYYRRYQLPNIEHHFDLLMRHSADSSGNLHILKRFFLDLKQEMAARIAFDESELFPLLESEDGIPREMLPEALWTAVDDKLRDLLQFFVVHLQGRCEPNLCNAVINAVFTLEKDVRQNDRIRSKILLPLSRS